MIENNPWWGPIARLAVAIGTIVSGAGIYSIAFLALLAIHPTIGGIAMDTSSRELNTELIQLRVPSSLKADLEGEARKRGLPFRTFIRSILTERYATAIDGEHLR